MLIETPFFLSIAGLSATLAGLAGLVAALRRGEGLGAADKFRLREIVEFCFANIIFAVTVFPLSALLGNTMLAFQVAGASAFAYLIVIGLVLARRRRRLGLKLSLTWVVPVTILNIVALLFAAATVWTGAVGYYAALLVALLVRPMLAFVFVLSSFEE